MRFTDDLFFDIYYFLINFAVYVLLYYWYVLNGRDSILLKVCRWTLIRNAARYAAAFFNMVGVF